MSETPTNGGAPRAVIFHSLADAAAAVAAADGRPLVLLSAPGAAGYAGSDFLKAIADEALAGSTGASAIIDCGEDAGVAMAALRAGWQRLVFCGRAEVRTKLADMAAQTGARIDEAAPDALDLLNKDDPYRACVEWFGGARTDLSSRGAAAPPG